jgi:hypothetical protein
VTLAACSSHAASTAAQPSAIVIAPPPTSAVAVAPVASPSNPAVVFTWEEYHFSATAGLDTRIVFPGTAAQVTGQATVRMTITNLQADRPTQTPGAQLSGPTWLIAYRAPALAASQAFFNEWGNDVRLPITGHDGWFLDGSTGSDGYFWADNAAVNGQDIERTLAASGSTTGTYYGRLLTGPVSPADIAIVLPLTDPTDTATTASPTSGIAVDAFVPVTRG